MNDSILIIENLKTYFPVNLPNGRQGFVKAVDGVNLSVKKGEVMGLVGESGSGKSTLAYTLMGMYSPTEGRMVFLGQDICAVSHKRSLTLKKDIQIVFQDPGSSLNRQQTIRQIMELPLRVHKIVKKSEVDRKIASILQLVELSPDYMYKSPASIGGGERQMVAIARALAANPRFIVLDEPTSALDVSIQAKIINMLMLKSEAERAVKDDFAEVVILGCTIQFGFYRELQELIGVPVIDAVLAPFKQAEYLVEVRNKMGWKPSKSGGFETPPVKEIVEWDLERQYGAEGLWTRNNGEK